jgi:hypothetical protein
LQAGRGEGWFHGGGGMRIVEIGLIGRIGPIFIQAALVSQS